MTEEIKTREKCIWGKIAVTIAFVGLLTAYLPTIMEVIAPSPPPPPIEEVVVDKAHAMFNKIKGQEVTGKSYSHRETLTHSSLYGSLMLAGLAFSLAIISFLKREDKRFVQSTVAVSVVIVGYNFLWLSVGIVVMAIILYAAKDLLSVF